MARSAMKSGRRQAKALLTQSGCAEGAMARSAMKSGRRQAEAG
jgi:hypothetical protein